MTDHAGDLVVHKDPVSLFDSSHAFPRSGNISRRLMAVATDSAKAVGKELASTDACRHGPEEYLLLPDIRDRTVVEHRAAPLGIESGKSHGGLLPAKNKLQLNVIES